MKAERLERMRDDPYYLTDDRQDRKPVDEDLDSIPIVRLDDLPPLSQGMFSFSYFPLPPLPSSNKGA